MKTFAQTQHDRRAADEMAATADRGVVQRPGHFPVTEEDAGSSPVTTAMRNERFTTASGAPEAAAHPGIAQVVERQAEDLRVAGSTPAPGAMPFRPATGNRLPGIFVTIEPQPDVLAPIMFERFPTHLLPRPQLTKPSAGLCSR